MKMDHIDEFTLNEYLDDALPDAERQTVAAHLALCAACQTELAELQQLFLALDAVPDLTPTTDLSAAVEAEIARRKAVNSEQLAVNSEQLTVNSEQLAVYSEQFTVNSWPLLILEIIAAGVLLFLLWPTVQEWLLLSRSWQTAIVTNVTWSAPVLWAGMGTRVTAVLDQLQSIPPLDLATMQWAILLGAALVVWLAGNRLLFTNNPPRQNGGSHG